MNVLGDTQDGSQIHSEFNVRDARLKLRDRIKQTQSKWKGL